MSSKQKDIIENFDRRPVVSPSRVFALLLALASIREIFSVQVYLDSFVPLLMLALFFFRIRIKMTGLVLFYAFVFMALLAIQFSHISVLSIAYYLKFLTLLAFAFLVSDWLRRSSDISTFIYFILIISLIITIIIYFYRK